MEVKGICYPPPIEEEGKMEPQNGQGNSLKDSAESSNANNGSAVEAIDLINRLPPECLIHIFSFLQSSVDRGASAAVCKKWLKLLVHFVTSELKSPRWEEHYDEISQLLSRRLKGTEANDLRLYSLVIAAFPFYTLTRLYVCEFAPSANTNHRISISDTGLKTIVEASPFLTSLTLRNCQCVSSKGIESVAEWCSELEELELINTPLIDDNGLKKVAESCLEIRRLSLISCPRVGNETVDAFGNNSLCLECISLVNCPLIGSSSIKLLVSKQHTLNRIRLVCMNVGRDVLKTIKQHVKKLEVFYSDRPSNSDEDGYTWIEVAEEFELPKVLSTKRFTRLKKVDIRNSSAVTDDFLQMVSNSAKFVKSLRLQKCRGFTCGGLVEALINWNSSLKALSLKECIIIEKQGRAQEPALSRAYPSLTKLEVDQCEGVEDWFLYMLAPACTEVTRVLLTNLVSITDQGLLALLSLNAYPKLNRLDIDGCAAIGDLGFCNVIRRTGRHLRYLSLRQCTELSDRSMASLGEHCDNLKEVVLRFCRVSNVGVRHILYGCRYRLRVLCLGGCLGITDDILKEMEVCINLICVTMHECPRLTTSVLEWLERRLVCDVFYL